MNKKDIRLIKCNNLYIQAMLFYEKNLCYITVQNGICLKAQKYIHDIDKRKNIDDDDDEGDNNNNNNNNNSN